MYNGHRHMLPNNGNGNMKSNQNIKFYEIMELARNEFNKILQERDQYQSQLKDYEAKINAQEDELMKMREILNQFENKHLEMERQYKQEIKKLKMDLENGGISNMNGDMRIRNRFNENVPPPNLSNNRDGYMNGNPQNESPRQKQIKNEDNYYRQQPPPMAMRQNNKIIQEQPVTGVCNLDPDKIPREYKREGQDWLVVYNPKAPRLLNVELYHNLEHDSVVCCVKFSSDGKYLATGCNRVSQIFDVASCTKVCELVEKTTQKEGDLYIRSVCFSPCGRYLATGAEDKIVRVWDIKKKQILYNWEGHDQDIYSLDWSKDGKTIVSGSGDRTVKVWNLDTKSCTLTMKNENDPTMPIGNDNQMKDSGVTSVAISPIDGLCVAAGSLDKIVRLWDTRTGKLLERFDGHTDSVYSVAFSNDGKSIVSGSLDKTLKIWDISPQTLQYLRSEEIRDKNFEPIINKNCRHTFTGHRDFVLSVGFSSSQQYENRESNEWVVSGSKDRTVTFWNANQVYNGDPTTVAQFMLQGHNNSVISIALSPIGGMFATGSGDRKARIWRYTSA
ncbi:transcriptional repressor TUP1 [Piromyces finnis]|uniref:Transcriptional repressor TUP1 n=1 Tax=Piromyces finnis TaxID=1754191 RepID=A0A1Y1VCY9_9FUNG|nr:transcriptional repressor TUP1 [Piromyces finnis]|eukprot:ORX51529.1 transcriptional repressor TUP1 [Piromyces finnis]